jgi:hypothetical protein
MRKLSLDVLTIMAIVVLTFVLRWLYDNAALWSFLTVTGAAVLGALTLPLVVGRGAPSGTSAWTMVSKLEPARSFAAAGKVWAIVWPLLVAGFVILKASGILYRLYQGF